MIKRTILLSSILLASYINATSIHDFVNTDRCDQIIDKKVFKVCYSYRYKAALAVWYNLDREHQRMPKIKKRPRFYSERTISMQYRAKYRDYTHSGYDRGHMANNWDFAYSRAAQRKTFSLCNIVAQNPIVNRKLWSKSERYERYMAIKLGNDKVINIVKYPQNPQRIGKDRIAVPSGFYKIIYNDQQGFKKCFYYKNYAMFAFGDKLKKHIVDCEEIQKLRSEI